MYAFCSGMYRACSTWQYMVVSHLIERYRKGRRMGFIVDGEQFSKQDNQKKARKLWQSLKVHDGHELFAASLAEGRALAVYAYRDIRDVVYSLMHKHGYTFEQTVREHGMIHKVLDNDRFWTSQPRTLVQRYENILMDPVVNIEEIA